MDREPDYRQMPLEELQAAARDIDRNEFPHTAASIDRELSKRANAAPLDWWPYRLGIPMWVVAVVIVVVLLGVPLGICGYMFR